MRSLCECSRLYFPVVAIRVRRPSYIPITWAVGFGLSLGGENIQVRNVEWSFVNVVWDGSGTDYAIIS